MLNPHSSAALVSLPSSAVTRRFLGAFCLSALLLGGIVATLYIKDVRHERAILDQDGRYVIDLEHVFLSRELRAVRTDLLFLAQQPALRRFVGGDDSAREALEREYLNFAVTKALYEQIRCLDSNGDEIIRINFRDGRAHVVGQDERQAKADRYYFQESLSLDRGQVFVSPFDLNLEHGQIERPLKPVIRFLTPVFDEDGEERGLFVLNFLGDRLLAKLEEVAKGFPGETMLVSPSGEYLRAPVPAHAWGWMLGHQHSFRSHFPQAWQRIRHENEGQFALPEGLFTYRRVQPAQFEETASVPAKVPLAGFADPSSLLLISYLPTSVVKERSTKLLTQLMLMYTGAAGLVLVLSLYWARAGAARQQQAWQLAESERRLRALSSRLLATQEAERRSISRDLHDELGQQVTAICLDLKSAARDEIGTRAASLLQRAIRESDHLLRSLHEIATRVRPSVLDDLGLQDAVESFVSEYQQRHGITVHCETQLEQERVPPTIGENVYRILQEALANVATHAHANEVWVKITLDQQQLVMSIEDHGAGFRPEEQDHTRLGILGMQERAELLGGAFRLISAPGAGTRIRVEIPVDGEGQEG